ncbi:polymer-forming cytoskeletal protein [Paraburkholderia sp. CNPSo 3155]|uniref:bactofilin family protein n=1 Tax=Paraburkholderia atlantica TaxID=2654982 RepID=UPI00128D3265|nr:polymer-forming cytoskeletal protein [Paraburkholderia atlantica]MPW10929.1 polymer-forming cytoskeletal protein [Paraburkholderia atlantica]
MKQQPLNVTLLSAGLSMHGDVILDHGMSNFGIVDGNVVSSSGLVHIGPGGMVKGQVEGEYVRVDGTVEGDVQARGALEINGRVIGNVYYYGTIRLGPRASLEGQVKRRSDLTIENAASNVQQLSRAASNS